MPSQVTNVASDDALTAIYRIQHDETCEVIAARLAEKLEVTAASVSAMLRRLARDELIVVDQRKRITLTVRGLARAEEMIRRHRLAECLLVDALGLDWWRAYEEAHLLEHALSTTTEELVRVRLGAPERSPFGYPIPGVSERTEVSRQTLAELAPDESAEIERVFEEDQELLRFFDDQGLRPGIEVRVRRHERASGTVEVELDGRALVLGYCAAQRIWVRAGAPSEVAIPTAP